jgi:DNA invertase Pin-like site-specific DNA recombinase
MNLSGIQGCSARAGCVLSVDVGFTGLSKASWICNARRVKADRSFYCALMQPMGAFAEFERSLIRERQREGIDLAKKKGVYTGRKPSLDAAKASELRRRANNGENKAALAREFGISRAALYVYLAA